MSGKYGGGLVQDNDRVDVGRHHSVSTGPITPSGTMNKTKVDQMLESQMISDLLRANGQLKALKQFRTTNEKHYQDKAIEEARRKEIREPLEKANIEIIAFFWKKLLFFLNKCSIMPLTAVIFKV